MMNLDSISRITDSALITVPLAGEAALFSPICVIGRSLSPSPEMAFLTDLQTAFPFSSTLRQRTRSPIMRAHTSVGLFADGTGFCQLPIFAPFASCIACHRAESGIGIGSGSIESLAAVGTYFLSPVLGTTGRKSRHVLVPRCLMAHAFH